MRFFPVFLGIFVSTLGCADLLGFGEGGAGGAGGGGTGATSGGATSSGGTTAPGGGGTAMGGAGGAGGAGGSGGTTASSECMKSAVEPCFEGPPEIDGVGLCKAGSRTCQADGTWGACAGQVKPAVEKCETPADESCDGVASCTGSHRWSELFGAGKVDVARGVAVDGDGNTIVTGEAGNNIQFGAQPISPNVGMSDVFVVKLDQDGKVLWGKTFGSPLDDRGNALAVDAAGDIYVAGEGGAITFPGFPLASAGIPNGFLAKLHPDGSVVWAKAYGGAGMEEIVDVAVSPDDSVVLVGSYTGSGALDGQALPDAGTTWSAFAAKVAGDGALVWAAGYGEQTSDQKGASVAVDGAGTVVLTADVTGTINFGPTPATALAGNADHDVAVAALDGNNKGAHLWSQRYGDAAEQMPPLVRATPVDGTFVLAMPLVGAVDVGGGVMECTVLVDSVVMPCAAGDANVAVWKWQLTGANMSFVWQRHVPSTGSQVPTGLMVDGAGHVLLAGMFWEKLNFGNAAAPLLGPTTGSRFLVKLGENGGHEWQRGFPGTVELSPLVSPLRVAADPTNGRVVLAGGLQGAMDLGGGVLSAGAVDSDVVVGGLAP